MRKNLPAKELFLGQPVPGSEYVVAEWIGSGCNAHVFRAHSTALSQDVACKVIPRKNLIGADRDPPTWWEEMQKANRIRSPRAVHFYNKGEWVVGDADCVYVLSEFVRGKSLHEHIKGEDVDIGFVLTFLGEMLDFLRELNTQGFGHGDFHEGNILVEDRSESLVGPRFAFRITDFGVARATSEPLPLDDYEQFAKMLRMLVGRVDYASCSPEDRLLYNFLRDEFLGKRLLESDQTFDDAAREPGRLFARVKEAQVEARMSGARLTRRALTSPFEFLSCEQIGEAHVILKELYSDKMLGLPTIEDRNNLVLTGPRGCGKTTVFRSLSLRHRTLTEDDEPESVKYLGVYYRCDDLYFAFPRYARPIRAEAIDVPMHFVVATLLRLLLESIRDWSQRRYRPEIEREEASAARAVWDVLGINKPQHPSADSFDAVMRALDKERVRAAEKARFANDPNQPFGRYFGPEVVLRVCDALAANVTALANRPVYFFIDDYSAPKITYDLQKSLNRLFMQRTSVCFFKLATESPASYVGSDIDGKSYVEGREFRLTNLGMDFISADPEDRLRFVDDVFWRRFAYTDGYPIKTLRQLVGDGDVTSGNETARAIREGKNPILWGRHALGELCSGDVHFLIELVSRMVAANGGRESLSAEAYPAVTCEAQNKAIRAEAGRFMRNLRALPNGAALVDVVQAFGNVAASYLKYRNAKNEQGNPPHQASRIEPYDEPNLEGPARQIYGELLRYSVFIEDVRGKSRRGKVVPRLFLRRFLIPFFNLTFSKRDSLELSVEELKELLLEPRRFEARRRLKAMLTDDPQGADQMSLLPGDGRGDRNE